MDLTNPISVVGSLLIVVVGIAASYAITKLAEFWKSKSASLTAAADAKFTDTKMDWLNYLLAHATNVIDDIVNALNDTYKKELLEATSDGKLTEDEKKLLLEKGKELVYSEIPENVMEELSEIVGDMEEWVRTKIENSVTDAKPLEILTTPEECLDTLNVFTPFDNN